MRGALLRRAMAALPPFRSLVPRVVKYVAIYTGDWRHWRLGTKCASQRSAAGTGSKKHLRNPTAGIRCKIETSASPVVRATRLYICGKTIVAPGYRVSAFLDIISRFSETIHIFLTGFHYDQSPTNSAAANYALSRVASFLPNRLLFNSFDVENHSCKNTSSVITVFDIILDALSDNTLLRGLKKQSLPRRGLNAKTF